MTDPLTTSQVAELAGVTPRTVRNWEEEGKLKAERTRGGHRRFSKKEVEKLIKSRIPQDGIQY